MNHLHATPRPRTLCVDEGGGAPELAPARAPVGNASLQDCAFIDLQNAYRPHGGLLRVPNVTDAEHIHCAGQACDVQGRVMAGELFGFRWYNALWIPMFQFNLPGRTAATEPQRVVAELSPSFDSWALASWFVRPNLWLANHRPIECLGARLPDVLAAARADRFVATC
jgi:hypothetical protein